MNRTTGCLPPDDAKRAAHPPISAHPLVAARLEQHKLGSNPLPPSADKMPPHKRVDQGQSGSCTAASFSMALFCACITLGTPLGFIPSFEALYEATRAIARVRNLDGSFDPLTDEGAQLEDVVVAASTVGVRPMKCASTPDGRFYDIWTDADIQGIPNAPPANVNFEPQPADLIEEAKCHVKIDIKKHLIEPTDSNVSDLMAAALDVGLPVEAAGLVDNDFEALGPNGVAQPASKSKDPGGHAIWFSKYRTNANGEREFFLENSWGANWADKGGVWCSLAFVRSLWSMYVVADVQIQTLEAA